MLENTPDNGNVNAEELSPAEAARYFEPQQFPQLDCLTARFVTHTYPLHTHETYVIGVIEQGFEAWYARGRTNYAGPMDLLFNNPLDVHDGRPHAGGYSYRMTYPSVALMQMLASEIIGKPVLDTPFFVNAVVHDREAAMLFMRAHKALDSCIDHLEGEELLLRAYSYCLRRHANLGAAMFDVCHRPGIDRVRAMIEDRYREDLELSHMAELAGLSRHHLIRAFRMRVGLTPHAYLIDTRIRRSREALRRGMALADVASMLGFADQAHFSRAFKAGCAVSPGQYARAVA